MMHTPSPLRHGDSQKYILLYSFTIFGSATAQLAVLINVCFWFAASYGAISVGYLGNRTKRKKEGVVRFVPSFALFALIVRALFIKLRNLEVHGAKNDTWLNWINNTGVKTFRMACVMFWLKCTCAAKSGLYEHGGTKRNPWVRRTRHASVIFPSIMWFFWGSMMNPILIINTLL